ncbi:unnamed protein product [Camellia sinensis]
MVGESTEAVGAGVGGGSSESRSRSLRMASVVGMIGRGCGSSSWIQLKNSKKKKAMRKNDRVRVCTASYSVSSAVTDPYKTLRIQPGASESEVKKAFRQLALYIIRMFAEETIVGFSFTTLMKLMMYLVIPNVLSAAISRGCTMLHPGYGFLAENAVFVEMCREHGINFIGPNVDLLRGQKSDKVDVTLQPEELEVMNNVLHAKQEEEKLHSQREDFSDMVAENEKKRKRKMQEKDEKSKKKDFKF